MRSSSRSSHLRVCRRRSIDSVSSRPIRSGHRRARRISFFVIGCTTITPAISNATTRRSMSRKTICTPMAFCLDRSGSCCIRAKRRLYERSKKRFWKQFAGLGETHPRALEAHLGRRRIVNAWGGYSKATTNALEWLHWRGLLRIARREAGIRIYHPTTAITDGQSRSERLRQLIMVHANIFAPSPEKSLQSVVARYRDLGNTRQTLNDLIASRRASERNRGRRQLTCGRQATITPLPMCRVACGSWRRSIRSSGTDGDSSTYGDGRTGSRPTRLRRSACAAITPCRCFGRIR